MNWVNASQRHRAVPSAEEQLKEHRRYDLSSQEAYKQSIWGLKPKTKEKQKEKNNCKMI